MAKDIDDYKKNNINSKENHELDILQVEKDTQILIKKDEETDLFVLPSHILSKKAESPNFVIGEKKVDKSESYLVEDGVVVPKKASVIAINSKVGNEFSRKTTNEDNGEEKVAIGRKGVQGKSANSQSLQSIKRKFGFSWKRYGRKISLFLLVFGVIGILLTSFVAAWLIDQYDSAQSITSLSEPSESSVVYARDGTTVLFKFFAEEKREIVELCNDNLPMEKNPNCIPRQVQLAAIALEDERFYFNETGIPWTNLVGATTKCLLSGGDDCRGASGLSQQLVKNMTGDAEFSIDRKIRELFTAMKLNKETTHTEILEMYLNTVPFGRNAYGVQEAAKSYYDKDIKNLSTPEACYLVALVQQPSTFSTAIEQKNSDKLDANGIPWSTHWETFVGRKNACLQKLHEIQLLPADPTTFIQKKEEFEKLKVAEVAFVPNKTIFKYPHFVDYVKEELKKFVKEKDLYTKGYRIVTTIDPALQEQTEAIVNGKIDSNVFANGANNTAAIVLDHGTGQIIAMIGSRDYNNKEIDGQVNIATSPQQPGSSIKPYVYATALSKDFNPGTIILDRVTDFGGGYRPTNYGGNQGYGLVTIRYALQNSLNISAVKAAAYSAGGGDYNTSTGINEVFNFAEKTGLQFPCQTLADGDKCKDLETARSAYRERCFLSAALGGCEVTMISHATGINTLLNDGNLRTATPFISIETKNNLQENQSLKERLDVLYPKRDAVVDPLVARQIANIMSDYNARLVFGPFRYNLELPGWNGANAVAAKTGTSNDVKDVWTVGGTPYYTTVVWVGNTDNSAMNSDATSANSAGGIWQDIMSNLHKDKQPAGFSTEGLRPYPVNCTGTSSGWCRGSELMTEGQIRAIQAGQKRMSSENFDPLNSSIFDFRDEIITRKVKVNKIDGKLAVAETPEAFIEEKECVQVLSGFPKVTGWYEPAKGFNLADPSKNCPTEKTVMTGDIKDMTITTNISSKSLAPNNINIQATPTLPGGSMVSVSLKINGQEKATGTSSIGYNTKTSGYKGKYSIEVIARDSYGQQKTVAFEEVEFDSDPLEVTMADHIASINCIPNPVVAGNTVNCTTTLVDGYEFSGGNYKIRIGNATDKNCTSESCSMVSTVNSDSGVVDIFVIVGSGLLTKKGSITLN